MIRTLLTIITCLTLLATPVLSCKDQSSCFIKKLFDFKYPEEDVYSINLNGDWASLQNIILGYGDFNNDLRADYLAFDPNTTNLLFFIYIGSGSQ